MEATKEAIRTVFNIDIDFLIILFVTVLGAIGSYFSRIYNRSREFKFIDFIAVVIVGVFIGFLCYFISVYFTFSIASTAILSSITSTISMSILTKINQHEGDILKALIKYIFNRK